MIGGVTLTILYRSDRGDEDVVLAQSVLTTHEAVQFVAKTAAKIAFDKDDAEVSTIWEKGHVTLSIQSEFIAMRREQIKELAEHMKSGALDIWELRGEGDGTAN